MGGGKGYSLGAERKQRYYNGTLEKLDSEEETEIHYRGDNVQETGLGRHAPVLRPLYKVKKGGKYKIKKIGEDTPRRVDILSRALKATGKYKHAYNVRELADNGEENVSWVDLKDYDVVKKRKRNLERMKTNKGTLLLKGGRKKDEGAIYMEGDVIS